MSSAFIMGRCGGWTDRLPKARSPGVAPGGSCGGVAPGCGKGIVGGCAWRPWRPWWSCCCYELRKRKKTTFLGFQIEKYGWLIKSCYNYHDSDNQLFTTKKILWNGVRHCFILIGIHGILSDWAVPIVLSRKNNFT